MNSLSFRARVPVFDANVRVGDRHDEVSPCRDRHALLKEMERHGVARALVYHAQTEEISPIEGNAALAAWLDEEGRLVPQWSVMPVAASMAQIQRWHAASRVAQSW